MLIAAALSDGICHIRNGLDSEDTRFTRKALRQLGLRIDDDQNIWKIYGRNGMLNRCVEPLFLGNSGTSMRLLAAVTALGNGSYMLSGTDRMCRRPIQDLVDGLKQAGASVRCLNRDGCPPIEVSGTRTLGGKVTLDCRTSSQYLSALLLIAPYTQQGIEINVSAGPVSRPYIDITLDVMHQFGINTQRRNYEWFKVDGFQRYHKGDYLVEADCSQAGYFWAAAAITGGSVIVKDIPFPSHQGDIRFLELLEMMGCKVFRAHGGIGVSGGPLSGIETDLAYMPDMAPTLAVVAAYAKGTTIIKNIAHLATKESNRLTALENELLKLGIAARLNEGELIIQGGHPHGAEIDTYDDHRIAMSFAVAGLNCQGMVIRDQNCVEKSFPNFWQIFDGLY
jgi:3-phosphoshikimate 1-carboxyvinyltransferase